MSKGPDSNFQKPLMRLEFQPLTVVSIQHQVHSISAEARKLHQRICYFVEGIQDIDREWQIKNKEGRFTECAELRALEHHACRRLTEALLQAVKSPDRYCFEKHFELLLGTELAKKGMTVRELISRFETGELHDFSILAK